MEERGGGEERRNKFGRLTCPHLLSLGEEKLCATAGD